VTCQAAREDFDKGSSRVPVHGPEWMGTCLPGPTLG